MATALFRFHLATAAPVALRAAAPLVAGLTAAVTLAPSPPAALAAIVMALVGSDTSATATLMILVVTAVVAAAVVRRCTIGLAGWARSLPAGDLSHRLTLCAAVVAATSPFAVVAAVIAAGAGLPLDPSRVPGLALAGGAGAIAALPVRRRVLAAPVALAAAWAALDLGWAGVAGGMATTAAAIVIGGPLELARRPRRIGAAMRRGRLQPWIAARAAGWRVVGPAAAAAATLLAGAAFLTNNELSAAVAEAATRGAGVASVAVLCAGLAEILAQRRPTWPWARSLPTSASGRVLEDAFLLAVPATAAAASTLFLMPAATPEVIASVPAIALLAAGAMRRAAERSSGASGEVLAGGLLAAAWIALLAPVAWVLLLAAPLLLRWACDRDRRLRVSSWLERHHLAAGDPLAWSDQG